MTEKPVIHSPSEAKRSEPSQSSNSDSYILPVSQIIIPGEDKSQYDEISRHINVSVAPTDIIEKFWCRDIVDLIWETFRLRRLKGRLIQAAIREGVRRMLAGPGGSPEIDELMMQWSAGDETAREKVNELLVKANISLEGIETYTFERKLSAIERIDRLIASAESRRNTVLREIGRHRDAFAMKLARAGALIEDAEFSQLQLSNDPKDGLNGQRP